MNSLDLVSLWKASEKACKNVVLVPGSYDVDTTLKVRVTGHVDKLPDSAYTPTTSVPLKTVLALALQYAGVTRERTQEIIKKAVKEALENESNPSAEVSNYLNDIDTAMARVTAITDSLPKKVRSGMTKASVRLQVIEKVEEEITNEQATSKSHKTGS